MKLFLILCNASGFRNSRYIGSQNQENQKYKPIYNEATKFQRITYTHVFKIRIFNDVNLYIILLRKRMSEILTHEHEYSCLKILVFPGSKHFSSGIMQLYCIHTYI